MNYYVPQWEDICILMGQEWLRNRHSPIYFMCFTYLTMTKVLLYCLRSGHLLLWKKIFQFFWKTNVFKEMLKRYKYWVVTLVIEGYGLLTIYILLWHIWTIIKLINNLLVNYMTASGLGLLHLLGPDYE